MRRSSPAPIRSRCTPRSATASRSSCATAGRASSRERSRRTGAACASRSSAGWSATVADAPEDVIAIIRAGARGYVTKTISGTELADAVRRVADGDAVFSPRLAGFVLDAFASLAPAEVDPELDQLTAREREVLRHIA